MWWANKTNSHRNLIYLPNLFDNNLLLATVNYTINYIFEQARQKRHSFFKSFLTHTHTHTEKMNQAKIGIMGKISFGNDLFGDETRHKFSILPTSTNTFWYQSKRCRIVIWCRPLDRIEYLFGYGAKSLYQMWSLSKIIICIVDRKLIKVCKTWHLL